MRANRMITTLLIEQVLFLILYTHARKNTPSLSLDFTDTESEPRTSELHPPAKTQKVPCRFYAAGDPFFKTATTYSPACAVPSA